MMKCHVVYDNKSREIVSVGYIDRPVVEEDSTVFRFGPESEDGRTVIEHYIPDEYAVMPVADLIKCLQDDDELDTKRQLATKSK